MFVAALVLFVSAIVYANLKNTSTGNVIKEDVFEGIITNMELSPGILEGEGVYDKTCQMAGNGMIQCDGGIQTEKGLLNFEYTHNMDKQPCISPGDKLKVEILENNKARVTRI